MIDRQSIERTVQQVADGEISLEQATERLLAGDWAEVDSAEKTDRETEFESLASLVERLGNPPIGIVEHWCQQLRGSLQSSPRPVDGFNVNDVNIADFNVTSDGLIHVAQNATRQAGEANLSAEEIERFIDVLRNRLVGIEVSIEQESSIIHAEIAGQSEIAKGSKSSWPKVAIVAGIALCGGALFWIVRSNSTFTVAESDTRSNVASSASSGNVFAEFPSTRSRPFVGDELFDAVDKSLSGPNHSSDQLETLQSLEATSEEEISLMEATPAPNFSLEDLIPSIPDPVADIVDPIPNNEESGTDAPIAEKSGPDSAMQSAGDANPNPEILSDDSLDAEDPEELQQPTRSAVSAAITLPPMDQTDPIVIVDQFPSEPLAEKLTLEFPHDIDVSMQPNGDDGGWVIVNDKGSNVLATVDKTENGLTFAWTSGAAKNSGSRSLHHGRITSSDGSTFFLRPQIEAKPWPIRLDQPDMRPTWDLGSPLPPSVTRLSVDIDLPEELEMTWVEPIPIESPRRARGLAILKPLDGESVDLAVKFDVRCSRKLSCRLRYAARLDSSMPWQLVSRDLLEQFANQLAVRAELVSREADRLQGVYDIAGTRGKRIIRVKQKYNDGLADSLRQFADRVAELESLIASVESSAALRFRVWVQWPSGAEQSVFVSVADES